MKDDNRQIHIRDIGYGHIHILITVHDTDTCKWKTIFDEGINMNHVTNHYAKTMRIR